MPGRIWNQKLVISPKTIVCMAALLLAELPASALAQEESQFSAARAGTPQFRQCMAVHSSNVDEGNCLKAELARQETFLKLDLAESLKGMTPAQTSQQLKAQQAWRTFRSENCRVRALNGGSGAGIFYLDCMTRETITRRNELSTAWDY